MMTAMAMMTVMRTVALVTAMGSVFRVFTLLVTTFGARVATITAATVSTRISACAAARMVARAITLHVSLVIFVIVFDNVIVCSSKNVSRGYVCNHSVIRIWQVSFQNLFY